MVVLLALFIAVPDQKSKKHEFLAHLQKTREGAVTFKTVVCAWRISSDAASE